MAGRRGSGGGLAIEDRLASQKDALDPTVRLSEEAGALSPAVQRSITLLVTSVVPIGFITAVLASTLIEVLYGKTWVPSAPVLRFLIILGTVRMLTQLAIDVLIGAGATWVALWLNKGWAMALVPALVLGTRIDGIRGAAIAHTLVATLVALPLALAALRRVGVHLRPITVTLIRPLLATAVGAASCAIVAHLTTGSDFFQLAAAGSVGLLTYIVIALPSEQRRRWRKHAVTLIPAHRADELA